MLARRLLLKGMTLIEDLRYAKRDKELLMSRISNQRGRCIVMAR